MTVERTSIYIKVKNCDKDGKTTQTGYEEIDSGVIKTGNQIPNKTKEIIIGKQAEKDSGVVELGKRIRKPKQPLLIFLPSKKTKKVEKKTIEKPKSEIQKRKEELLRQIMIEQEGVGVIKTKKPTETHKNGCCTCGLCDGCSFTTFMDNAANRILKLKSLIRSAPPQKQMQNNGQVATEVFQINAHLNSGQAVIETNEPTNNGQVSETNPTNSEQVAHTNAHVNSAQQSMETTAYPTNGQVVTRTGAELELQKK